MKLLCCRLVPQTNVVIASYTMIMKDMSSTLTHNFAKDATVLTATKKLPGGQAIKASFGLKDKAALVEFAKSPLTVSVSQTLQPCSRIVSLTWLLLCTTQAWVCSCACVDSFALPASS